MSSLVCRNVRIDGRRTSIKLEASMWHALADICERSGRELNEICTDVGRGAYSGTFTSAMRVYILDFYRQADRRARTRGARTETSGERESARRHWSDLVS